jgi:hypothetical protein
MHTSFSISIHTYHERDFPGLGSSKEHPYPEEWEQGPVLWGREARCKGGLSPQSEAGRALRPLLPSKPTAPVSDPGTTLQGIKALVLTWK